MRQGSPTITPLVNKVQRVILQVLSTKATIAKRSAPSRWTRRMMQVTGAAFQTGVRLASQPTDPKSHTPAGRHLLDGHHAHHLHGEKNRDRRYENVDNSLRELPHIPTAQQQQPSRCFSGRPSSATRLYTLSQDLIVASVSVNSSTWFVHRV